MTKQEAALSLQCPKGNPCSLNSRSCKASCVVLSFVARSVDCCSINKSTFFLSFFPLRQVLVCEVTEESRVCITFVTMLFIVNTAILRVRCAWIVIKVNWCLEQLDCLTNKVDFLLKCLFFNTLPSPQSRDTKCHIDFFILLTNKNPRDLPNNFNHITESGNFKYCSHTTDLWKSIKIKTVQWCSAKRKKKNPARCLFSNAGKDQINNIQYVL